MKNQNQFMMLFRFNPSQGNEPTEKELEEMSNLWGEFIGGIALQEKLVYTHQLGFEGKKVTSDLTISNEVVIADGFTLGGNMVIKANSIDEATELAKGSPILKMGGTVEVRSIVPMS